MTSGGGYRYRYYDYDYDYDRALHLPLPLDAALAADGGRDDPASAPSAFASRRFDEVGRAHAQAHPSHLPSPSPLPSPSREAQARAAHMTLRPSLGDAAAAAADIGEGEGELEGTRRWTSAAHSDDDPLDEADRLLRVGLRHRDEGRTKDAILALSAALRSASAGGASSTTPPGGRGAEYGGRSARIVYELAALHRRGETRALDVALYLYEKALRLCRAAAGEEHPFVSVLLEEMGTLYVEMGDADAAEKMCEEMNRWAETYREGGKADKKCATAA